MNHTRVRLVAAATLLALAACRRNSGETSNAPPPGSVSNSGFAKRPLADSVKAMALTANEPPGIVTFTGDHRSIARVIYVGQARPLPAPHKSAILLAGKTTGTVPLADDVKNELLFREGTTDYWMPVGAKTEPEFQNLKAGQEIDLYASFVAAVKDPTGKVEYVFVAQEYGDVAQKPAP